MEIDQQTLNPNSLSLRLKTEWAIFVLILWEILLLMMGPTIVAGDSGETVAAVVTLGVAHPPGHPLLTLLGRLACFVPLGSMAFRLHLFSSVAVILSALVFGCWTNRMLKKEGFSEIFGFGAAFSLVFMPMTLEQALTAKGLVYTLSLLWAVFLLTSIRFEERNVQGDLTRVAFWFSLALATHWPSALAESVFVLAWIWTVRSRLKKGYAVSIAVLLFGLTCYLLLPLRSKWHPVLEWGDPEQWKGFWWTVSRSTYAHVEMTARSWRDRWMQFLGVMRILFLTSPWFWFAPVGILYWGRRRLSAAIGWLLGFAFPVMLVIGYPKLESGTYDLASNYLSVFQVWGLFLSFTGLAYILQKMEFGKKNFLVLGTCLLLIGGIWAARTSKQASRSGDVKAYELGLNILQALPRDSFFLAEGEPTVFSVWHGQCALDLRRDVAMVPSQFFLHPWGWRQAVRMRPQLNHKDLSQKNPRIQWNALRESFGAVSPGFPGGFYLSMERTTLLAYDPGWVGKAVPAGLVFSASKLPTHVDLFLKREAELRGHQRWRPKGVVEGRHDLDLMSQQVLRYYADESFQGALWLEEKGDLWDSLAFFNAGFQINPGDSSAYSSAARVLGKAGYPEASVDLCRKGLGFDFRDAVLQNNLRFSLHLAAMESPEGKTKRYNGLLRQARKFHWEFLLISFKETADRLSAEKGWIQHDGI